MSFYSAIRVRQVGIIDPSKRLVDLQMDQRLKAQGYAMLFSQLKSRKSI